MGGGGGGGGRSRGGAVYIVEEGRRGRGIAREVMRHAPVAVARRKRLGRVC